MTNLWSLGHGAVANLDATNTSLKLINVDGTKGDNSLPLVANTSTRINQTGADLALPYQPAG